jgi:electron transport complex protein RnfA
MQYLLLFISTVLVNNFVLSYFLGICPFIGVSDRISSAIGLGVASTFVMAMTAAVSWFVNHKILLRFDVPFLQYVAFILVIAALVQLVEMFIKKTSPTLYRALGIFLPLITTNCAILGLALLSALREYSFLKSLVFGVGAGVGFTMALVIMAGIREQLETADIPPNLKGAGITLITASLLALSFMGFQGLIKS